MIQSLAMLLLRLFVLLLFVAILFSFFSCANTRQVAPANNSGRFANRGVDFSFGSDGYQLKGKIFTQVPAGRKVPLLVFCVGSGTSSFETNYGAFIDTIFLQTLPMDSLAILVFDKRGVGGSEGHWHKTDFAKRAADAYAAAAYAKSLPYVDSSRIFVTGHSQGGWISEIALANYPHIFAGGIALAGAAYSVKEQLINDYQSQYRCRKGMTGEIAAAKAKRTTAMVVTVASIFPFTKQLKQLKRIWKFDPSPYLLSINKPFVFFFGENDPLVSPEWNKKTLSLLFQNSLPAHFDTVTIKGANHSFKETDLCYSGPSSAVTYAPGFRAALLEWVRGHVLPCKNE